VSHVLARVQAFARDAAAVGSLDGAGALVGAGPGVHASRVAGRPLGDTACAFGHAAPASPAADGRSRRANPLGASAAPVDTARVEGPALARALEAPAAAGADGTTAAAGPLTYAAGASSCRTCVFSL
jgi:hypothetical protein